MHVLSFPPLGSGLCAFFCLAPLFLATEKKKPGGRFLLFFLFSFFSYLLLLYWIPKVMVKYGGTTALLGGIALIALAAFLSLFAGLAGMLIGRNLAVGAGLIWSVPAVWIAKDLVVEKIISGFPWCLLGYSQIRPLFLAQWSEWGGVHLVSALIVAANVLLYLWLRRGGQKRLLAWILFLATTQVAGYLSLQRARAQSRHLPWHQAGILQPNVRHDTEFGAGGVSGKLDLLFRQSRKLRQAGCEFAVWPEYSVPRYPLQDPPLQERFQRFARAELPLFTGFTDLAGDGRIYNALLLFSGDRIAQYNKVHLTPFGEYIPFRRLLFFVKRITDEISDFTPGDSLHNLELAGRSYATPICYEVIYPELVRSLIAQGAELIITISNDSWFGNTSAPHQHLAMATFRAIENRRFLLRSTSNGISAAVAPSGRLTKRCAYDREEYFAASFQYRSGRTLFCRGGYLFPYAGALLALVSLIVTMVRAGKREPLQP